MVGHFQEFEDEYLEMMYEFHEADAGGIVRTGDLAAKLDVSPASATEMVQRLATRGYLEYIPYKGAKLTEQGLAHGQKMKRRHRLAEVLLDLLPYTGHGGCPVASHYTRYQGPERSRNSSTDIGHPATTGRNDSRLFAGGPSRRRIRDLVDGPLVGARGRCNERPRF